MDYSHDHAPEHHVDTFARWIGPPPPSPVMSPASAVAAQRANVQLLLDQVWREAYHAGLLDQVKREAYNAGAADQLARQPPRMVLDMLPPGLVPGELAGD